MFKGSSLTRILQSIALFAGIGSLALAGNLAPAIASEPAISSEGEAITASSDQTFLYGETAEANQLGKGYIVFQQQQDRIVGAFYYPQSEFSCFIGKLENSNLRVLSLPTHQDPISSFSLSMNELTAISNIGSAERQSLAACQQDAIAFLQENQTAMEAYGF